MIPIKDGVFEDKGFYWTRSRVPGQSVYGERVRKAKGQEFRHWNPHRSKLSALLTKHTKTTWMDPKEDVLYLGASTGTTVSHVSDLLAEGSLLYAVEFSARSARDLLWNLESRSNVVPILADASEPATYTAFVDRPVGALVQDVAQRHQVEIFLRNLPFVKPGGLGFLFVKARSIDVARDVDDIYGDVEAKLRQAGLSIVEQVRLDPFERDHMAFVVRKS